MNRINPAFLAKTQRRNELYSTPRPAQLRSLNSPVRICSAPLRLCRKLAALLLMAVLLATSSVPAAAQEVVDTIRVDTRVVFMDALVKEKRTGIPISDLKPENFEVFDNGLRREISYFTREGQARKPLALVIILDCREDGAGRFLKRPEVIKAMSDEMAKLPPGDEIAIMAMNIGEDEKRVWLTTFTNDRSKLAAALARVPEFVQNEDFESSEAPQPTENKTNEAKEHDGSSAKEPLSENEVIATETIKGKNGAVITRSTRKDGSVDVKRTTSDGRVVVEMSDIYDMSAAVIDATHTANRERPNSQPAIVWVSDGIAPIFFEDRDATEQILIRNNVIFNSLTVELRTLFKLLLPIGKPVAGWVGLSLYGSAKRLAQQSGGEAVKINRVKDYGTGLSRIFGNLTARYSLGFALTENETDDGSLHNLELKVKAPDAKGKLRKIEVSSRRGYYMSTVQPSAPTSAKN